MIGISKTAFPSGVLCVLIGLLAGCARMGIPVLQSEVAVPTNAAAEDAVAEDAVAKPAYAEAQSRSGNGKQSRSGKQRRDAAIAAFEVNRDQIQYEAALARWKSGDAANCQKLLEEQLLRKPNLKNARQLLTDVYMATNQPDRALENARIAGEQFPESAEVLHAIGLTFEALEKNDGAIDYFRRAFALDDQTEIIRLNYQNAVESASETPEQPGQSPGLLVSDQKTAAPSAWQQTLSGLAEASQSGDASRTETLIAELLDRPEARSDALPQAGKWLLQRNQPELALRLLESAVSRQTESATIYRVIAMAYYRIGDYEATHRAIHFSLSLDKSSALSYFLLGATFSKLGMSESAERSYRRSTEIDPRYSAWK